MIRKIKTSLIVLLILTGVFISKALAKNSISQLKAHKTTLYLGNFYNLPTTNFSVLYDGEIIEIEEAFFAVKDQLLDKINFLFVDLEKINFCLEDNTVQELLLKTENYLFFELEISQFPTPSDLKNSYSSSWKITKKKIDNQIIPLNTIIIPLSPSVVEVELQNVIGKPSNLAIKLPIIKLTAKSGKTLKNLMLESYLKAISLKPFYTKQRIKSINQNAIKVCLII